LGNDFPGSIQRIKLPGKAIVVFLSETEREKILFRKNLYFYGDPSRMDKERLLKEIEQCRKRGFAEEIG
jgi:DNA-binding IclR family transcriptional regulator